MGSDPRQLFRKEVEESRRSRRAHGQIVFLRPVSYTVYACIALALAGAVVALFTFGTHVRHVTLFGQLVPVSGVIDVRASGVGIIASRKVSEGDAVTSGQILYVISSDVFSKRSGAVHETVAGHLDLEEKSLLRQIEASAELERIEYAATLKEIASLTAELEHARSVILSARDRLALLVQTVQRYSAVAEQGVISQEQLAQAQRQFLDAKMAQQQLERDENVASYRLSAAESRLATVPTKYASQRAQLEQALAAIRRVIAENEGRRLVEIRSPADGIATAVTGEPGQPTDSTTSLLAIVPDNAVLEAHLLAPTAAVGFLEPGREVMLRYDAFPHQRFGTHIGVLASVSRAGVGQDAVRSDNTVQSPADETFYRVKVHLKQQAVFAYDAPRKLQAGMTLRGDVRLETRRIYQMIFDPLYAMGLRK
jgi:membrane fusion protein